MNMKNTLLSMAGALLLFTAAPRMASTCFARPYVQQDTAEQIKTFSGTILKNGDKFVLRDRASKIDYVLDDAKKASQFEGKKVKVTGTVDVASNTIHVNEIEEIV
jgi:uncharacterized protein YdeI (BOF family)